MVTILNVVIVANFSLEKNTWRYINFNNIPILNLFVFHAIKKFRFKLGLLKHLEFGEFCSHQCYRCLKTFTRKNDLEKHRKICESVGQPGGTCSICCKSFELQCDLELHRKKIIKSSMLELQTSKGLLYGHTNCSQHIIESVSKKSVYFQ